MPGYIIHSSFSDDDGKFLKDADGVTNNEVIWSGGGTIHIVTWGYQVSANQTLKVQYGAIVKFTSEIKVDINGNTIFTPGGEMLLLGNAKLFMEGAVMTDIRDDVKEEILIRMEVLRCRRISLVQT